MVEIFFDTTKTFLVSMDCEPDTNNIEFYIHDNVDIVYSFKVDVKDINQETQKMLGITTKPT